MDKGLQSRNLIMAIYQASGTIEELSTVNRIGRNADGGAPSQMWFGAVRRNKPHLERREFPSWARTCLGNSAHGYWRSALWLDER